MLNASVAFTALTTAILCRIPFLRPSHDFYDQIGNLAQKLAQEFPSDNTMHIGMPTEFNWIFGDNALQANFAKSEDPFGLVKDDAELCHMMKLTYAGMAPRLYLLDYGMAAKLMMQSKSVGLDPLRELRFGKMFPTAMIAVSGDVWKKLREIFNAFFRKTTIAEFDDVIVDLTDREIEKTGAQVDFKEFFKVLALKVIGKTGFDNDLADDEFCNHVAEANTVMFGSVAAWMSHPASQLALTRWFPTSAHRRLRKASNECREVAKRLVAPFMPENTFPELSLEPLPSDSTNEFCGFLGKKFAKEFVEKAITLDEVIDNAKLFIVAGHETTANLLAWTMAMFAEQPAIYARCRDEVRGVLAQGAQPTSTNVKEMPYLFATIIETLRMYPPIPIIERRVLVDFPIEKTSEKLAAGTSLIVHVWAIHHRPDYWPEPYRFNPDRHLECDKKIRLPNKNFFVFGQGVRACPGQILALNEVRLVLARILNRCDLEFDSDQKFPMQVGLTIAPKFGVKGRIAVRQENRS